MGGVSTPVGACTEMFLMDELETRGVRWHMSCLKRETVITARMPRSDALVTVADYDRRRVLEALVQLARDDERNAQ